jgi:hypothetical protein
MALCVGQRRWNGPPETSEDIRNQKTSDRLLPTELASWRRVADATHRLCPTTHAELLDSGDAFEAFQRSGVRWYPNFSKQANLGSS